MQKMDKTTEHASAEDFFKFLGVLLSFIFTALFFFLKLLGNSDSKDIYDSGISQKNTVFKNKNSIHYTEISDNTYDKNWD